MARPVKDPPVEAVRVSRIVDRKAIERLASGGAAYAEPFIVELRIGDTWFALARGPSLRTFTTFEKADALRRALERRYRLASAA